MVELVAPVVRRRLQVSTLEPWVARGATEACHWLQTQVAVTVDLEGMPQRARSRVAHAMRTPRVALVATAAKVRLKVALVVLAGQAALLTHLV